MERYIVNIDGQEFEGAPTMTPEEVQKAFDAAVAEWPDVRREHNKKWLLASILRGIAGERMSAETGVLDEEVEKSLNEWQVRHGIFVQYGKGWKRLTAWTKEGRMIGPEIKSIDTSEDAEFTIRIRHEKVAEGMSHEGILERFKVTINGKEYTGAPTYTRKGAEVAFEAALAEKPALDESRRKLNDKIKKMKAVDEDKMHNAIKYLRICMWHLAREWETRHGVAGHFFMEDEKFHLGAWTEDGLIMGPVAG